jgi:hypothetical protein
MVHRDLQVGRREVESLEPHSEIEVKVPGRVDAPGGFAARVIGAGPPILQERDGDAGLSRIARVDPDEASRQSMMGRVGDSRRAGCCRRRQRGGFRA